MKVLLEFDWVEIGEIKLLNDMLVFPPLATIPGLYRFRCTLTEAPWQYIGETDNLKRRIYHYSHPGPSQQTNIRLNDLMKRDLSAGNSIVLSIIDHVAIEHDGTPVCVGLTSKYIRRFVENAALIAANGSDIVHNL